MAPTATWVVDTGGSNLLANSTISAVTTFAAIPSVCPRRVTRWLMVRATLAENSSPPMPITPAIQITDGWTPISCAAGSMALSLGVSLTPRAKQIDIAERICKRSSARDTNMRSGVSRG
jgi:hypothetical protein